MGSFFRDLSLKYKFLLVFLVFVTLPTLCFGVFIYFQMNHLLHEQAQESAESILNKIEGNVSSIFRNVEHISSYAIYNEDFRTYMMTPVDKQNDKIYRKSLQNVKGYLTFQLLENDYIHSITVHGVNDNWVDMGTPIDMDEDKWNEKAKDEKGKLVWSGTYTYHSNLGNKSDTEILSGARVINDYNHIKVPIGFIRIRLDVDRLRAVLEPAELDEVEVFIKDKKGNIILSSDTDWEKADDIKGENGEELNLSNPEDFVTVTRHLKNRNWDVVAVVNQQEVTHKLAKIKTYMLVIATVIVFLGLMAVIGYYRADIRRIIHLTWVTRRMEKRDFTTRVHVTSKDEIGQLGLRFNEMLQTIQNYIDKEYKLTLRQKDSRLKSLQSRIDPHFLYNTLDMIRWKARIEKAPETSHLIEKLSHIFRGTLKDDGLWITCKEEMDFIDSYMALQERRLNGRLHFDIFIEESLEEIYVIKQMIQPLVENAIKYGFPDKIGDMNIQVWIRIKGENVIIDVFDNGIGLTQKQFENSIYDKEQHALGNIHERIVLAFGEKYGLSLLKGQGLGTTIRITMPIIRQIPTE